MERRSINGYEVLAVATLMFSFMGAYPVFYGTTGSLQWIIFYYGRFIAMVFFAFYCYTKKVNAKYANVRAHITLLSLIPVILILPYSIIIWLISGTPFPYISRGITNTIFSIGSCISGIALVAIFKDRVFKLGAIALLVTFFTSLALGLIRNGTTFLRALLSPEGTGTLRIINNEYVELHEVIFSAGLYIICFLFFSNQKGNFKMLILCIACFLLGFKRIGIAALILVVLFMAIAIRLKARKQRALVKITGVIAALAAFIFVKFSVSDELTNILMSYGISMSGRNIIYDYFRQFCSFSPEFFGRGVGFVAKQFDYATVADLYNMVSIKALHNDLMKIFLEIGFWGFISWLWYWLLFLPRKFYSIMEGRAALTCFALILYAFMTYTTDNTQGYFNFQLNLIMLIAGIMYNSKQSKVGLSLETN